MHQIYFSATASRARRYSWTRFPKTKSAKNLHPDPDFLLGLRGKRHPYRVTNPLGEQDPKRNRVPDRARDESPRLGDADMEWTVGPFREKAIGRKRLEDVRRLCGNDDIAEVFVLKQLQVSKRRTHKRLGNVDFPCVEFFAERLLERAEVYADANRDLLFLRCACDCLDPVTRADVAWI